jgi:hypothetical protein
LIIDGVRDKSVINISGDSLTGNVQDVSSHLPLVNRDTLLMSPGPFLIFNKTEVSLVGEGMGERAGEGAGGYITNYGYGCCVSIFGYNKSETSSPTLRLLF